MPQPLNIPSGPTKPVYMRWTSQENMLSFPIYPSQFLKTCESLIRRKQNKESERGEKQQLLLLLPRTVEKKQRNWEMKSSKKWRWVWELDLLRLWRFKLRICFKIGGVLGDSDEHLELMLLSISRNGRWRRIDRVQWWNWTEIQSWIIENKLNIGFDLPIEIKILIWWMLWWLWVWIKSRIG